MNPLVNIAQESGRDPRYDTTGFTYYHIIEDAGTPLTPGTGLFVYTPKDTANVFYAVTVLTNNIENDP